MDELDRWQIEEVARRAREIQELMARSGVLDSIQRAVAVMTSPAAQTAIEAVAESVNTVSLNPDVWQRVTEYIRNSEIDYINMQDRLQPEMERVWAMMSAVADSAAGVSSQVQASLAEVIAGLDGLHRAYTGIGATFDIILADSAVSEGVAHARRLELSAGRALRASDDLFVTDTATAELTRPQSATVLDGDLLAREVETATADRASFSLDELDAPQSWRVVRQEGYEGIHQFSFSGRGEKGRAAVEWLYAAALSLMRGDDPAGETAGLEAGIPPYQSGPDQDEQEVQEEASAGLNMGEGVAGLPITEDDFVVLWKKRFSNEQLREARRNIAFGVAVRIVESVLAQIERQSSGKLSCLPVQGLTQVRFVLMIQGGKNGLDITVSDAVPGVPYVGYYSYSTRKELPLWHSVGIEVMKWIGCELDRHAAEILIAEKGRDAFEDTALELFANDQPVDVLQVTLGRPLRLWQAVASLLELHGEVQSTFLEGSEQESTGETGHLFLGIDTSSSMGEGLGEVAVHSDGNWPGSLSPWEYIRDHSWDRSAVQLLWEGQTDPDIARRLNVSSKRVTNRLSELRRQFPEYVPTRAELRRLGKKTG